MLRSTSFPLASLTVKSWTEEAEEAAAAMLNSANPAATGRTSGDAAAKVEARGTGGATGKARRGRLFGSSTEEEEDGETAALLRRRM